MEKSAAAAAAPATIGGEKFVLVCRELKMSRADCVLLSRVDNDARSRSRRRMMNRVYVMVRRRVVCVYGCRLTGKATVRIVTVALAKTFSEWRDAAKRQRQQEQGKIDCIPSTGHSASSAPGHKQEGATEEETGTSKYQGVYSSGRNNNTDGKQQCDQRDQNSGNGDDQVGRDQEEEDIRLLWQESASRCTRRNSALGRSLVWLYF
jgi:hypothetical protein